MVGAAEVQENLLKDIGGLRQCDAISLTNGARDASPMVMPAASAMPTDGFNIAIVWAYGGSGGIRW